jgi:PAS domain S-box-containing protein
MQQQASQQDRNEDPLRVIAEYASDYISRYDREGRFLYLNPALLRLVGGDAESRLGKTSLDLAPSPTSDRFHKTVLNVVATGQPQMIELQIPDLTEHVLHHQVYFSPERNADGEVVSVIGIGRDITPLKVTEAKLRQREHEFRTIAENSPDLIMRCDPQGCFLYASPHLQKITGIPALHYHGTCLGEVELAHGVANAEERAVSFRSAIDRVVQTGAPEQLEIDYVDRNGTHASYEFRLIPERDASGAIISILMLGRDNTQQKAAEAELKLLNATLEVRITARTLELERANRDLRSFADTASHDLRAPLRAISGFVSLIAEQEGGRLSQSGRALLERVSSSATKLNDLISGILAYSQAGQSVLSDQLVPMESLAREVSEALLERQSNVQIEIADLPAAHGDVTMLRQILQNLIGNAIKFSSRRSQPRIEVKWRRRGHGIVYYVRDNGVGFDMQHAHKLCSMFQRLHSDAEFAGSGVGLAIVKRLVERHGGLMWAESRPEEGATFYFTLPEVR